MTNKELEQLQVSKIKTSYVHSLQSHKTEIDNTYLDKSVSTEQFKTYIRNIIMNTNSLEYSDKSPATKRFLMSLNKQYNKAGIITLVYNSMLKADGLGVI